jgi:hypothetical protein
MKHSIELIFGKEEININRKEYHFETKIELDAFLKGLNEAVGWTEFYQLTSNEITTLI